MQKIFLRGVVVLVMLFVAAFFYSTYRYYRVIHSDDPVIPIVLVESGSLTLVHEGMAIDMIAREQYNLSEKDILITHGTTMAVVTWPDRSETRLGPDSRMQIEKMQVADDYSHIEIEFGLEQGQAWSTVVRTIYPGSYFRTRIPGQGIIAGVRGTVYNIDVTHGYIHSIDHSVSLSDKTGKVQSLLPGEIVSINDIFRKLGKEVLDTAWYGINQARDEVFFQTRNLQLREQIDMLSGKSSNIWDHFVRRILSIFPSFQDIPAIESLFSDILDVGQQTMSRERLFSIYQKIQDKKFIQEREQLRKYILQSSGALQFTQEQAHIFVQGAVWDSLLSSGATLPNASILITNYTNQFDTQVRSVLQVIPIRDIETKSRETLRKLIN